MKNVAHYLNNEIFFISLTLVFFSTFKSIANSSHDCNGKNDKNLVRSLYHCYLFKFICITEVTGWNVGDISNTPYTYIYIYIYIMESVRIENMDLCLDLIKEQSKVVWKNNSCQCCKCPLFMILILFKVLYNWAFRLKQVLYCDLRPGPKILFQGNTPEGSDTFQRPVIERDPVGGLRLMIWDKVKVPLCHYSHAPEESNLWTAWQLFPLDDD